jgi:hypothetical protein
MSEPAEELQNTPAALTVKTDPFLIKENLKIVEPDKGLVFFNGQCIIHVANRLKLRQQAYELVYNLYAEKGFTKTKDSDLWLSIFNALPATTTLISQNAQGLLEGTLTVVFDSPMGLPADELYREEIDLVRNSGGQICEIVSLGIRNKVKSPSKILAGLIYCSYLLTWHHKKTSTLVITVNPKHEDFYCKNMLFEKIGPERSFAKVNGAPSVLLKVPIVEYSRLKPNQRVFPFFMMKYSAQEELEMAKKVESMVQPMSSEEFFTFFIEKTDTWERALPSQKAFIKSVYPANKINHYEVSRALARGFSKKHDRSGDNLQDTRKAMP